MKKRIFAVALATCSFWTLEMNAKICVAHRCLTNGNIHLENSLHALRVVAENPEITHIEFDIHHTKDLHPIVYHDPILERNVQHANSMHSCPIGKRIKDLNLEEIEGHCVLINHEKIPLLEDFLELIKKYKLHPFIELKDSPSYFTMKMISSALESEDYHLISFFGASLHKAIRLLEILKVGIPKALFLSSSADAGALKIGKMFDGIGLLWNSFEMLENWEGKTVNVWTVNEKEDLLKCIHHPQINYITSNYSLNCMALLKDIGK